MSKDKVPSGMEVFWSDERMCPTVPGDKWTPPLDKGWYFWWCQPGCLPHSDPFGPFETEDEAIAAAREDHSDAMNEEQVMPP